MQIYLVNEVQQVYKSQGVPIHDKHIELIVRQMLRKVSVIEPGDTELLPQDLVERKLFASINDDVIAKGGGCSGSWLVCRRVPCGCCQSRPRGRHDTFRGFVEQHGDHYDYVGSPCPVDAEACILAIYTYRIVPVTPQAARALDRVSGGVARLTGVLESTGDAEHQGTLYVWRIGGGGGR